MEEALRIQRESEIIEMTGWTFDQYDDAPAGRLARMMLYITTKRSIEDENQKNERNKRGKGGVTGPR